MFRKLKIFFSVALVIGVISLVFFLFYSTKTHYKKLNETTQYIAILETKFSTQGSRHKVEDKLEDYISNLKKNNDITSVTVPPSTKTKNAVEVIATPNSKSEENLSATANGGDKVDQLIQKSLEKSKPELHSEGDEPVDSTDSSTEQTPTIEVNSEQKTQRTAPVTSAVNLKPPSDEEDEDLDLCPEKPKSLTGPLYVNQVIPKMEELEKHLSEAYGGWVKKGGAWRPTNCKARVKMALIVPFRKRYEQLGIFVRHMHPMLKRQELDYRIIIVEQSGATPFNRAILFNIGYKESLKFKDFDCFIFHDVDLIPEDDRNMYTCPTSPRHMSVAVDKFNYQLPYASIFGGAGSFRKNHFEEVNGFSNKFWGWGGEDDDLYQRIVAKGHHLTRPSLQIGRYKMIRVHHHQSSKADPNSGAKLRNSRIRMMKDGLNSLKYKVLKTKEEPMYTMITVEVNQRWV
ncbi:beta-1,4-N-acetylgalactosaminyltransferase bre-4-like isoform X2 [Actinia tenebrosa]|uniref:Beta-1,4-galactosyltransferase n=1 Tax=Actinia tenebrosa TaxID=6105 RepID=A0A6P8IWU5_ACTTE|nr:beta-1,4-N-acetylgalactosaminyltransferase bre-4-like isoform X2 [Actinia tenebrosa]